MQLTKDQSNFLHLFVPLAELRVTFYEVEDLLKELYALFGIGARNDNALVLQRASTKSQAVALAFFCPPQRDLPRDPARLWLVCQNHVHNAV
jgi:hypothetical protein